jgi:hypothetical protein
MHAGQSTQPTFLRDEGCVGANRRSPGLLVAVVLRATIDLQSPILYRRERITQAAERDANLHLVPPIRHAALGLPTEIRAEVRLAGHDVRAGNESPALALRAVGLHTERIDDEHERAVAFGERIEMNLDVVVGTDVIAIGEGRAHRRVRLEGANAEVDRIRGIPDEHLGRIGRWPAIDRRVDGKASEERRALPHGFVEHAIDVGGCLDVGDRDG